MTDDSAHGENENPGLKTSGLSDFLEYVCSRVVNASEMLHLKKMKATMGSAVHYAEFCAGMGTGTIALEPELCSMCIVCSILFCLVVSVVKKSWLHSILK